MTNTITCYKKLQTRGTRGCGGGAGPQDVPPAPTRSQTSVAKVHRGCALFANGYIAIAQEPPPPGGGGGGGPVAAQVNPS